MFVEYRWLAQKYPRIIKPALESETNTALNDANPNGEFDNLYLDMNGIIHHHSHPENGAQPSTEEMKVGVWEEIDRHFNIVRPRKLLYLALDGVAPRAKTNQQRMRRFLASKNRELQREAWETWMEEHPGEEGGPEKPSSFDSNCITPGTEFMDLVASWVRELVEQRRRASEAWRSISIVVSDSSTPGEGEHKIMDFIRAQRLHPHYDANMRHVVYGLDADLIMLSLATHELSVSVLREKVYLSTCEVCALPGHMARDCPLLFVQDEAEKERLRQEMNARPTPMELCEIFNLRTYLQYEFVRKGTKLGSCDVSLDRLIDDFVFLTFFVGNDFLPHMISLVIREGAFELLFGLYEDIVPEQGYLVEGSTINAGPLIQLLKRLGEKEDKILKKRALREAKFRERDRKEALAHPERLSDERLKEILDRDHSAEVEDPIRDGTTGWQQRYYSVNLGIAETAPEAQRRAQIETICQRYVEGLAWVLRYYSTGVPSWQWHYPYHYAPLAEDLAGLDTYLAKTNVGGQFPEDEPFTPLEQLMAVLPPQSSSLLPLAYAAQMTEPQSPVAQYYPVDFRVDMRGKQHEWQGIPQLPFIDPALLLPALRDIPLTDAERQRNTFRRAELYPGPPVADTSVPGLSGTVAPLRAGVWLFSLPKLPNTYRAATLPEARPPTAPLTEYAMASDLERNVATVRHTGLGLTPTVVVDYSSPALYPEVPPSSPGYKILVGLGWTGGPLGLRTYTVRRVTPVDMSVQSNLAGLAFDRDKTAVKAEQEKEKAGGESTGFTVESFLSHNQIRRILQDLKNSCPPGGFKALALPPGLSPRQRAMVHQEASALGLSSTSVGLKENRSMLVTVGEAPQHLALNTIDLSQPLGK